MLTDSMQDQGIDRTTLVAVPREATFNTVKLESACTVPRKIRPLVVRTETTSPVCSPLVTVSADAALQAASRRKATVSVVVRAIMLCPELPSCCGRHIHLHIPRQTRFEDGRSRLFADSETICGARVSKECLEQLPTRVLCDVVDCQHHVAKKQHTLAVIETIGRAGWFVATYVSLARNGSQRLRSRKMSRQPSSSHSHTRNRRLNWTRCWPWLATVVGGMIAVMALVQAERVHGQNRHAGQSKERRKLWREGSRVELVGTFQRGNSTITFRPEKGEQTYRVLENLALQRVAKMLVLNNRRLWRISAEAMEYENANFLLLKRVVVTGKTKAVNTRNMAKAGN